MHDWTLWKAFEGFKGFKETETYWIWGLIILILMMFHFSEGNHERVGISEKDRDDASVEQHALKNAMNSCNTDISF